MTEKPLVWVGSSKKDLLCFSDQVRKSFGHALHFAQNGSQHPAAKVLKHFGSAGVVEVIENDIAGTYRVVYTVRFKQAIFVLHCFQKKSKSGMETPKKDLELIQARLKIAEIAALEWS
jgi:phage-related protein